MVEEGASPMNDRIRENWGRLEIIGSSGQDIEKLKESLAKIEKVSGSVPPADLDRALSKLEDFLSRIETKLNIKKEPTEEKEPGSGDAPPQEQPVEEEKPKGKAPKEETEPPAEEKTDEPPPIEEKTEEETEKPEDEEVPKEEPEATEEETTPPEEKKEESEEPQEEKKETEAEPEKEQPSTEEDETPHEEKEEMPPVIDPKVSEEKNRMVEEIEKLDEDAKLAGGETGAIQPHIKAMKDALSTMDLSMFDQYYQVSKDWLDKYLLGLMPTALGNMIGKIKEIESKYMDIGKEDRLTKILPPTSDILKNSDSTDVATLRGYLHEVKGSMEKIDDDQKNLSEDILKESREYIRRMKELVENISEETKKRSFLKRLNEFKDLTVDNILEHYNKIKALMQEVSDESSNSEKTRFEKILKSVEPMISKIAVIGGEESDEHLALVREKDQILSEFPLNIEKAMEGMKGLLDKAVTTLSNFEEIRIQSLENSISKLNSNLEEIEKEMDISPVKNILEKAKKFLDDNDLEKVELLMEKAEAAFDRLKAKVEKGKAGERLKEILTIRDDLKKLSMDVSPLDGSIDDAKEALKSGEMNKFNERIEDIEEKIVLMKKDEIKMEYQKLLVTAMNSIRELENKGEDVKEFRENLEKIKEVHLSRDIDKCIEMEKELLTNIRKIQISTILESRLKTARETLAEAEGLLIDTTEAKKKLDDAQSFLEQEKFEESLEMFTTAQVELEDSMTTRTFSMIEKEIKELKEQGKSYSISDHKADSKIKEAYDLGDDGKYREALELLYSLRDEMSKEFKSKKAISLLGELSTLIKKARSVGLKIATFKAAYTKAKVLLEAGDEDSVIELAERQLKNLNDKIQNQVDLQSHLDEIRGKLIGVESKVNRLIDMGVSVAVYRDRMNAIKELIETTDTEQARKEMSELENSINDEIALARKGTKPKEALAPSKPGENSLESAGGSPEGSKKDLFELVSKISNEMKVRSTKGEETATIKKDIEAIQIQVLKKNYTEAYAIAKACLDRISK